MSERIVSIIRIDFDWMENERHNAREETVLATFISDPGTVNVWGKVEAYVKEMEPVKLVFAWDHELYPQFRFEERWTQ